MNGVAIPFAYDMSLTYYENHVANISKGMMGGGNFYRMYHGVTQEEVNALGRGPSSPWRMESSCRL